MSRRMNVEEIIFEAKYHGINVCRQSCNLCGNLAKIRLCNKTSLSSIIQARLFICPILKYFCVTRNRFFKQSVATRVSIFTDLPHWADSVIELQCPPVCLCVCVFVTVQNNLFRRLLRSLVKDCVANNGMLFLVFKK